MPSVPDRHRERLDAVEASPFLPVVSLAVLAFVVGFVGDVPILRPLAGAVLVLVVPGALLLALFGVPFDRAESAVYAVGGSIAVVFLYGIVSNDLLTGLLDPVVPVGPFEPVALATGLTGIAVVGVALVRLTGARPRLPSRATVDELDSRFLLLSLQLPLLAAVAGVAFVLTDWNVPWLLVMVVLSLVPLWFLVARTPRPYRWLGLWCLSLALLYQVTLSTVYFSGGDGSIEYFFGHLTVVHDSWWVGYEATKGSLLSLTMFHPTTAAMTGLPLRWAIKLVYPPVFALTAVAIYLFHRRHLGDTTALVAAAALMFLHPFFNLLAQNTRTGLAVFFLFAFALVATDDELTAGPRAVLALLFLGGIAVSHYGAAAMFLGLATVAFVLTRLDDVVRWADDRRPAVFAWPTVAFFGMGFFAWYIYTASGTNFTKLVGVFVQDVLFGFSDFFSAESNSVQAVTRSQAGSVTFQFIKAEFVVLTLLGGLGMALTALASPLAGRLVADRPRLAALRRRLPRDDAVVHPLAFAFAVGSALLMAVSFTPVSVIGTARIYAIAGPFVVPYGIAEVRRGLTAVDRRSVPLPPAETVLGLALAGMLLVNAGVLSAAVTHDRSPQPHFDREYVLDRGSERLVYNYYRSFTPPSDVAATRWIIDRRAAGTTVFAGIRHSGYEANLVSTEYGPYHPPGPPYRTFSCEAYRTTPGYFLDSEYQNREGQINLVYSSEGAYPYVRFTDSSVLELDRRTKVYDNGWSEVYYSDGRPATEPGCTV